MQRRTLTTILAALAMCGGLTALIPLAESLRPSARTDADLPRISTSAIKAGSFAYAPDPYSQTGWRSEILLVRNRDGQLRAWFIPVKDGTRRLPDGPWWKPGRACSDLKPDFEIAVIYCADLNQPEWVAQRYRWSLEGKRLSDQTFDMVPIQGVEESGYFVVHKRSAA